MPKSIPTTFSLTTRTGPAAYLEPPGEFLVFILRKVEVGVDKGPVLVPKKALLGIELGLALRFLLEDVVANPIPPRT